MSFVQQGHFESGDPRAEHCTRDGDFYAILLGMAGHDLRQPLQVLQSAHDWLHQHYGQGIAKSQLDRGQRAILLIAEQLDRLTAAVQFHDRLSDMRLSNVALAPVLERVIDENQDLAMLRNIDLRLSRTSAAVLSNEIVLESIVRNLVHNAIKYTPPGNKVLVGCRRATSDVRIDIWDTGIGMAPHQVPTAFEAFKRLDSSSADGLGLGLFVVRRAVALLGHRIEVQSRPGKGSRFSILARQAPSL